MSRLQTRTLFIAVLLLASVGLIVLNQAGQLDGVKAVLRLPLTALQRSVALGGQSGHLTICAVCYPHFSNTFSF